MLNLHGCQLVQPSFHPSTHPSIHSSFHPPIHPPTHPLIHPFIHSSTHPSIHSSFHPPIHSFIHPLIHPFFLPSTIHPPTHPLIHPFIHPSIYSFILHILHAVIIQYFIFIRQKALKALDERLSKTTHSTQIDWPSLEDNTSSDEQTSLPLPKVSTSSSSPLSQTQNGSDITVPESVVIENKTNPVNDKT